MHFARVLTNLSMAFCKAGPALAGVGPNARPRCGAPLCSGYYVIFSVNRPMTFLMEIFRKNNYMKI